MTPQEIFDKALNGVAAQGGRSTNRLKASHCAYRGAGGRKCSVGHLIDDETAKKWDAQNASAIRDIAEDLGLPAELEDHVDLLEQLQCVHDTADDPDSETFIRNFTAEMKDLADELGLVFKHPSPELAV